MNCQLYSGWRLGKHKPGIIPDGEGLVEAAGESIEVWGVGFGRGVGVGSSEGDGATVIELGDDASWEQAVGFRQGGSSNIGEGADYALGKDVGCGFGSGSEESS